MKIALFGNGKMGQAIANIAPSEQVEILMKISRKSPPCLKTLENCNVFIDFSSKEAVFSHLELALSLKKPIVIGTTGWENEIERAKKLVLEHNASALYAPNFSLGVALFFFLLKHAKKLLQNYDVQGIEVHHREKKDFPSGTAKAISNALEINDFSSVRCGTIAGIHEVIFDSPQDTIRLIHESKGREAFAKGAIVSSKWLKNKTGWFTLDDLIRSVYSFDNSF